ncbi:MAG: hypothetical protein JWO03_3982 [Bacteroidetes bacterium]|nr:hypothetical protein [Bacteroidota bacterium]
MKKYLIIIFICLCSSTAIFANNGPHGEFPEWGKVTMEELKMTECSFEKNADAFLLYDLCEVYFANMDEAEFKSGKFRITNAYYQRYKIFTANGTRKANRDAVLKINDNEELKNIKGVCYELVNGQIKKTELKPEDIHTTKLSENEQEVSFTIPGVSPGCVFEWRYDKMQDVTYTLPSWYFTTDVPSGVCRLTVGFLSCMNYYEDKHASIDSIHITSEPFISDIDVPAKFVESYGGFKHLHGKAVSYTTNNLKSYNIEPYTNTPANYLTWIGFQFSGYDKPFSQTGYYPDFSSVSNYFFRSPIYQANVAKNPIPKRQMAALIHDDMSDEDKARVIYDFVRKNVGWVGGGGITPSHLNADIWRNKSGTWPDISVLLISALRSVGIKAYPMIIGSRHNPVMNKVHPLLDDYIGLDVLVDLDDAGEVVLDATDRHLPFGEPDVDQVNTSGLVLMDKDIHYWFAIEDKVESLEDISIDADYDETGKITGTMRLAYTNHSGTYMIKAKKADNQEIINEYLKYELPNATVEEVSDSIDESSATFIYRVRFSAQTVSDNDGNIFMSVASVFGSTANPFADKSRIADIDFGFRHKTRVKMTVHIPESYSVDALPASASTSMPDTSAIFTSTAEVKGNKLILTQALEHRKSVIKASDYPAFYDFEKKYYDLMQRPLMLRKKS